MTRGGRVKRRKRQGACIATYCPPAVADLRAVVADMPPATPEKRNGPATGPETALDVPAGAGVYVPPAMKNLYRTPACASRALAGFRARCRPPSRPRPTVGSSCWTMNKPWSGDIECVGEPVTASARAVGETLTPADRVLRLCASLGRRPTPFSAAGANLNDPDERLRLANWCHLNGLRDQALAEVKAAVDLRPPPRRQSPALWRTFKRPTRSSRRATGAPRRAGNCRPSI